MSVCTLTEIQSLLATTLKTRGHKELTCAGDVAEALADAIPEAAPVPPGEPSLALLTGIPIIPDPSFAPGAYRLVQHDRCDVDVESRTVAHDRCTVLLEGNIRT
ncbi:MAG TPA: hypothetical protein VGS19_23840 [Streptosporangiaceae bacterium]|nr:hypothetical protein [Streptosporangiaceae bacterium]